MLTESQTYTSAKTTNPVSQCNLVGFFVVVRDGRHAHEPFMSNRPDWSQPSLHGKVHIARPDQFSLPASFPAIFRRTTQPL